MAVSENKVLCHPASVDSLTTSAGTEDHVSMGGFAARKCLRVVEHVEQGETHTQTQTDRQTDTHRLDRQTDTDRHRLDRHTDRQTQTRQTDRHTQTQTRQTQTDTD